MTQSVIEMACGRGEKLDGLGTWDQYMLHLCIYIPVMTLAAPPSLRLEETRTAAAAALSQAGLRQG